MSGDGEVPDKVFAEYLRVPEQAVARVRRSQSILDAVLDERRRAEKIHPGTDDMPDGTGGGGRQTWERIAKIHCDRAAREGTLTFADVLDEEASEALAETDPLKLREELVQVMAVCLRWVDRLDREAAAKKEDERG
jgi:hypothetical protein